MLPCDDLQWQLPQFVADGEPRSPAYTGLIRHLGSCACCADYARRLRMVEKGLRGYPALRPDPALTKRVLEVVAAEQRAWEAWNPLPWNVWLPTLAIILALLVFAVSLPPQSVPVTLVEDLEHGLINWSVPLGTWATSLRLEVSTDRFWAIWTGVFVATAGIGLSLGLARWSRLNSRSLDDLEAQISDAVQRVLRPSR
ncbi:MAG: hypothetical protein FJZ90_06610 [Chloroflexi bacterium]|nr:hypothetical protein [Chloroflexota bacterium]